MTLWLAASITTDDRLVKPHILEADTPEHARDQYLETLGKLSFRSGVFVATWRLGNYPKQWLATMHGDTFKIRDMGRQELNP